MMDGWMFLLLCSYFSWCISMLISLLRENSISFGSVYFLLLLIGGEGRGSLSS